MPSLFDADPISLPIGKQGTTISPTQLTAEGFTQHQATFYPWFQKLLHISKRIKAECTHCEITELANGIILIRWNSSHDLVSEQPSSRQYAIVLNLEDRFGKFGPINPLKGIDLLSEQSVVIETGSTIPKEPLVIKLN